MHKFAPTAADILILMHVDVNWHVTGTDLFDHAEFYLPGPLATYTYNDKNGRTQTTHVTCFGLGMVDINGRTVTGPDEFRAAFPDGTIPKQVTWRAPSWIEIATATRHKDLHRVVSTAQSDVLAYLREHAAI